MLRLPVPLAARLAVNMSRAASPSGGASGAADDAAVPEASAPEPARCCDCGGWHRGALQRHLGWRSRLLPARGPHQGWHAASAPCHRPYDRRPLALGGIYEAAHACLLAPYASCAARAFRALSRSPGQGTGCRSNRRWARAARPVERGDAGPVIWGRACRIELAFAAPDQ